MSMVSVDARQTGAGQTKTRLPVRSDFFHRKQFTKLANPLW